MGATLPPLPYDYNALEPHISEEIMKLHHDKHHQTYVTNLNAAEDKYAKATSIKEKIALQSALKFNGGGKSCLVMTVSRDAYPNTDNRWRLIFLHLRSH